ncbi:class A beta-lactamase [Luteibacter sp. PPL552]
METPFLTRTLQMSSCRPSHGVIPLERRAFLSHALMGVVAAAIAPVTRSSEAVASFAALERRYGGRLGVAILDTTDGRHLTYRADERFMMCSTFKLLLVGAVLARVDRGEERLDRRIVFGDDALVSFAPVTGHHVGQPGLTVAALCSAAIAVSDGVAANLLLKSLGGPQALTAYARQLGDVKTRLDRYEPEMNRPTPDGLSDTTTPSAMLDTMRTLVSGNALSLASRSQLVAWLAQSDTGEDLVKAGIPRGWRIAYKTGHGNGATNDIAVIYPPHRKPIWVSVYYKGKTSDDDERPSALFAEVGRMASAIGR